MFKRKKDDAYLSLGSELFLFDLTEKLCNFLLTSDWLKDQTAIHIFLTDNSDKTVYNLTRFIPYLYNNIFEQNASRINLYYPEPQIVDDLRLHQVSTQWYNFFVNLWDEIIVDGLEEPIEYMFYKQEMNQMYLLQPNSHKKSAYSLEMVSPRQFYLYYCVGDLKDMLLRGTQYDSICVKITGEQQYKALLQNTEANVQQRKKIVLIVQTDEVEEQDILADGFLTDTEEE